MSGRSPSASSRSSPPAAYPRRGPRTTVVRWPQRATCCSSRPRRTGCSGPLTSALGRCSGSTPCRRRPSLRRAPTRSGEGSLSSWPAEGRSSGRSRETATWLLRCPDFLRHKLGHLEVLRRFLCAVDEGVPDLFGRRDELVVARRVPCLDRLAVYPGDKVASGYASGGGRGAGHDPRYLPVGRRLAEAQSRAAKRRYREGHAEI